MRLTQIRRITCPQMLLLATTAGLVACGSSPPQPTPSAVASYNPGVRPSSPATVAFLEPQNGSQVPAGIVNIRLQLNGGTIVRQTSTHVTPTEGHIHFSVNDRLVAMNYSTMQDVPFKPGLYKLTAEFVGADHFPFDPRVTTTIVLVVMGASPSP